MVAKILTFKNSFGECDENFAINEYNNDVANLVNNRISSGDKLVLVDMQCGAEMHYINDMIDNLHPNSSGENKMGTKWFEAINSINTCPQVFDIPDQNKAEGANFDQIQLDNYVDDIEDPDANITWTTIPQNPTNFIVTINTQRIATITPKNPDWNGSETITFVATDKGNLLTKLKRSGQNAATFTVHPVNDPPKINFQYSVNVIEDNSVLLGMSSVNASDVDNPYQDLSFMVQDGEHYTHIGNTVTPEKDRNGNVMVNVVVSDGLLHSAVFSLRVDISPVNDPPVITDQTTVVTNEEVAVSILKSHLIIEDVDNNLSEISFTVFDGLHYTRIGNTITPNKDFFGTLLVPVQVSDLYESSPIYQLQVNVMNVNDPPLVILPENLLVKENNYYSEHILIFDPDSTTPEFTKVLVPAWLTISPNPGEMHGTAGSTSVGQNTVTIRVSDGVYSIDTTFYIMVENTNDPPVIKSSPVITGDDYKSYYYKIEAEDPDSDLVLFNAIQIPEWASFDKNSGELTGMPKFNDIGDFLVKLTASDGKEETLHQIYC
ncbi:MAG: hypothetical protein HC906_15110 [Bacteroidales bacterium]|nr:hypothetical protein [Bacteroidales bacterium]